MTDEELKTYRIAARNAAVAGWDANKAHSAAYKAADSATWAAWCEADWAAGSEVWAAENNIKTHTLLALHTGELHDR